MKLLVNIMNAVRSFNEGDGAAATPAVTNPQKLALGQAVIIVLIVLGFDLDSDTQQLLIGLSAALGAALPLSDAVVRNGRARGAESLVLAQQQEAKHRAAAELDADGLPTIPREGLTSVQRQELLDLRAQLLAAQRTAERDRR
jgi:hypothetical protein